MYKYTEKCINIQSTSQTRRGRYALVMVVPLPPLPPRGVGRGMLRPRHIIQHEISMGQHFQADPTVGMAREAPNKPLEVGLWLAALAPHARYQLEPINL
jgi:hypothetical protein